VKQKILLLSMLLTLVACQPEASQPTSTEVAAPSPPISSEEVVSDAVNKEPVVATVMAEQKIEEVVPMEKAALTVKKEVLKAEETVKAAVPAKVSSSEVPILAISDADAFEVKALALAKRSNCFLCHAIHSKVVGPAWKDVAAKYRDDAGAKSHLLNKIAKGGSGVWGSMAMPPQTKLSEVERNILVDYILWLK